MTYEIKRGVEIPKKTTPSKYPFAQMEVGDCFHVPAGDDGAQFSGKSRVVRAAGAAHGWGKVNGKRFATRRQADGSYIIWRIA